MNSRQINLFSFLIALAIHAGLMLFVSPTSKSRHHASAKTINLCLKSDSAVNEDLPQGEKVPPPKRKATLPSSPKKKPAKRSNRKEQEKSAVNDNEVLQNKTTPLASSSEISSYLAIIRAHIEQNKRYPRFSKRQNHEGTSIIRLVIAKDGSIVKIALLSSSGYSTLDKAAMDAVKNSSPFSPPSDYGLGKVSLDIPLCYLLH
ncbi:MAG: energy transducer TonB [Chlorobiales bacterium]|nr:energy transducer TonB [Chlorobiales bacterium]